MPDDALDLGNDVFVVKDWVLPVQLVFRDGPESLEKRRFEVTSEDNWVLLQALTEEGEVQVLLEEGVAVQLVDGKDSDTVMGPGVVVVGVETVPLSVEVDIVGVSSQVGGAHQTVLADGAVVHTTGSGDSHAG